MREMHAMDPDGNLVVVGGMLGEWQAEIDSQPTDYRGGGP